jgi:hypothetical protein
MQMTHREAVAGLGALAREAHRRHEQAEQEEHRQRVEARRRELEQAARAHVQAVLASVDLRPELIEVEDVEAQPFDGFGGSVRLVVDGIPLLYDYSGPSAAPSLAVIATCTTCGQTTAGDSFTSLAELGAALSRPMFKDPERVSCGCSNTSSGRKLTAVPATQTA